jgi:hypothetical protein
MRYAMTIGRAFIDLSWFFRIYEKICSPEKANATVNVDENGVEDMAKGPGSVKRHNRIFTLAFKLEAVNFAKQTSDQLASEKFQVCRDSIRNWRKNEDAIKML